jgi:hypothetical protein
MPVMSHESCEDTTALPGGSPIAEEIQRLRQQVHQRDEQLASLPVIEQAKGMLMRDFTPSPEVAFQLLASIAKATETRVQDVAERLVRLLTGTASTPTAERSYETVEELRQVHIEK